MVAEVRTALPKITVMVEMFSDAVICLGGDAPTVVQLVQRWWLREDGTYEVAAHRADNPLVGYSVDGSDPQILASFVRHVSAMHSLA